MGLRNTVGQVARCIAVSLAVQTTMEWFEAFRSHAVALPNLAKFAIVMAIIAGAPALARRVRIPELVGRAVCA